MATSRKERLRSSKRRAATCARPRRSLAKLTRPRVHAAIPRERLFRILDDSSQVPVVWIAGPPGVGKTVLGATWLKSRRLPGLWYQLDPGDADPATFFFYLKKAAEAAGVPADARLPLLTAEYRGDVLGFTQRWFRELFAQLPDGAVLALDNYQEVAPDSMLHQALATASAEIPGGSRLLVMSWTDPPAEFSRLRAHERLARIGSDALLLTPAEAARMAVGSEALTAEQIEELRAKSGGWAAGFTLLRERTRRTGFVNRVDERATMQEVFDYFMALVFRDVPADGRDAIAKTAVLPRFTEAMAIELTGNPGVADLLESLYRRHLFVERRYGADITYQYHVLFRAFLLDKVKRHSTADAVRTLSHRAAEILESAGAFEDAMRLHLDAGDHGRAATVLENLASDLVVAGRGGAFREWLANLPAPERDRPYLSYWLGTSFMGESLPDARAAYERAFDSFVRDGDRTGQAMALTGMLQTFLHARNDDVAPIERWLGLVESLFVDAPAFPSSSVAARAYGTLVGIMSWMAPTHPMFPVFITRLEALLAGPLDDEVRVTAAGLVAEHYATTGFVRDADRVVTATEPVTRKRSVSPLAQTYWNLRTCWRDWVAGRMENARAKVAAALEIATAQNRRGPGGYVADVLLAHLALDTGHPEAIPALLEQMPDHVPAYVSRSAGQNHGAAVIHALQGTCAAEQGDLDAAVRHTEQALGLLSEALVSFRCGYSVSLASFLVERRELDRARVVVERTRHAYPPDRFPLQGFRFLAIDAIIEAGRGNSQPLVALGDQVRRLQDLGVAIPLMTQPIAARQLAELLVRHGIELPYVHAWIRRMNLRPSSPDVPNWPWPVRVRTLGEFRVEIDGAPLRFSRKAPRKPLELLQAVVAFGGNEVPCESLCDALWPDSDGDTSAAALRITLGRLRKLLRHDVVLHQGGKISLDARSCWIDLWSFHRLCGDIEAGLRDGAATRLLDAYRGAFLANEREAPWMLRIREQSHRRFAGAVAILERGLEDDGRRADAAALRRSVTNPSHPVR